MKFYLVWVVCSQITTLCTAPITNPTLFNDFQSCQLEGYKQSQKIIERADPINVNENKIYIKFGCVETPKKEV